LGLAHAPVVEGRGHRLGVVGQFGQLPLPELGVGDDDGLALAGQVPAGLAQHGGGRRQSTGHGVERTVPRGRPGHAGHDALLEKGRSTEEDFPLVGEEPEEGAFGQAGPGGDLSGGGLVESPLRVESESRFLEPSILGVDSH
jgi:hypothetical protein